MTWISEEGITTGIIRVYGYTAVCSEFNLNEGWRPPVIHVTARPLANVYAFKIVESCMENSVKP